RAGVRLVAFGAPDRAEADGIGRVGLLYGLFGDRHAVRVVAGPADQAFLGVEVVRPALVHPGDELLDLGHDLGADAVAGKKEELEGGHVASRCRTCEPRIASACPGKVEPGFPKTTCADEKGSRDQAWQDRPVPTAGAALQPVG